MSVKSTFLDFADGVARLESPYDIRVAVVIGLLLLACSGGLLVGLFGLDNNVVAYILAGLAITPIAIVLWRRRIIARENRIDPPYFEDPDL